MQAISPEAFEYELHLLNHQLCYIVEKQIFYLAMEALEKEKAAG